MGTLELTTYVLFFEIPNDDEILYNILTVVKIMIQMIIVMRWENNYFLYHLIILLLVTTIRIITTIAIAVIMLPFMIAIITVTTHQNLRTDGVYRI